MPDFNLISIESTWLTNTGEETGRPCKTVIQEIGSYSIPYHLGSLNESLDWTQYQGIVPGLKGEKLTIQIHKIAESVLDEIKTTVEAWLTTGTPFNVTLTRGTRSYDFDCKGVFGGGVKPIEHADDFEDGYYFNVTLHFIIHEVNS